MRSNNFCYKWMHRKFCGLDEFYNYMDPGSAAALAAEARFPIAVVDEKNQIKE